MPVRARTGKRIFTKVSKEPEKSQEPVQEPQEPQEPVQEPQEIMKKSLPSPSRIPVRKPTPVRRAPSPSPVVRRAPSPSPSPISTRASAPIKRNLTPSRRTPSPIVNRKDDNKVHASILKRSDTPPRMLRK